MMFGVTELVMVLRVLWMDLVLSSDNAIVIAMVVHQLPEVRKRSVLFWGACGAMVCRITLTSLTAVLLGRPGMRILGGLILVVVAMRLLLEEEAHGGKKAPASVSRWQAVGMIVVADLVMSLDNILGIAAASQAQLAHLVVGLVLSITIMMAFGSLVARLMDRWSWLPFLGAGLMAYIAGVTLVGDPIIVGLISPGPVARWAVPVLLIFLVLATPIWWTRLFRARIEGRKAARG